MICLQTSYALCVVRTYAFGFPGSIIICRLYRAL